MGDSEEKVAMLSLGWYVLFSFRKQARERKGRRVREERRRIQIPTEWFFFFFFPDGSFQKADVMWGMLKCWFVVNSPGKHSWGGNCRKAVCVWINIPDGGPELTECWCQEQHALSRHPSPPKTCKLANCTNYPNLYQCPAKCSQSCHLTCLNKKVLLYLSKQMYPLIETKNPILYISKILINCQIPPTRWAFHPITGFHWPETQALLFWLKLCQLKWLLDLRLLLKTSMAGKEQPLHREQHQRRKEELNLQLCAWHSWEALCFHPGSGLPSLRLLQLFSKERASRDFETVFPHFTATWTTRDLGWLV